MAKKTRKIKLFPAGEVKYTGREKPVIVDKASFDSVVAFFKKRGNDLPFDYEHATKVKGDIGEAAPANGFITGFEWEDGIVARVQFLDEAEALIADGKYRYCSPVFDVDRKTNRIVAVFSAALTNTPMTENAPELIAASGVPITEGCDRLTASIEAGKLPEYQAADELNSLADLVCSAGRALRVRGLPIPEDTGPKGILELLIMSLEGGDLEPEPMSAKNNTEPKTLDVTLRERLKLDEGADTETILARVDELVLGKISSVPKADYDRLEARVKEMETERIDAKIDGVLEKGRKDNKALPDDPDSISFLRDLGHRDFAKFEKYVASLPSVVQPGRMTSTSNTPANKAIATREQIISREAAKYDSDKASGIVRIASKESAINGELIQARLGKMTPDEMKQYAVA